MHDPHRRNPSSLDPSRGPSRYEYLKLYALYGRGVDLMPGDSGRSRKIATPGAIFLALVISYLRLAWGEPFPGWFVSALAAIAILFLLRNKLNNRNDIRFMVANNFQGVDSIRRMMNQVVFLDALLAIFWLLWMVYKSDRFELAIGGAILLLLMLTIWLRIRMLGQARKLAKK